MVIKWTLVMPLIFIFLRSSESFNSDINRELAKELFSKKTYKEAMRFITGTKNDSAFASDPSKMAAPDNCSPRKTTVIIDQPKELNHLFWPSCTRVMQCGGCSGHESQVCVPTHRGKTTTKINVVRVRLPYAGAATLEYVGMEMLEIESHTDCVEECRVKPEDCDDSVHVYSEEDCSCRCKKTKYVKCSDPKTWDTTTCSCRCPKVKRCRHGLHFSYDSCSCEHLGSSRFASANTTDDHEKSGTNQVIPNGREPMPKEIIDSHKSVTQNQIETNNLPTFPSTSTTTFSTTTYSTTTATTTVPSTTTTTATTTSTTTPPPPRRKCRTRKCPFRWVKVRQKNGCWGCKPKLT